MTFLVTLITSVIERFFDWSHLRHWQWYTAYQQAIAKHMPQAAPALALAATILPVLLVVFFIEVALGDVLYGFLNLLFQLIVVLYCIGPRNLWADAFASITAYAQGNEQVAAERLKLSMKLDETGSTSLLHGPLLDALFVEANRRLFGVIFWYVLLGPVGAVLYRTVTLSAESVSTSSLAARTAEAVINWLPVRVFTFLFALGGHFSKVLACWRRKAWQGLDSNDAMLIDCGVAALGEEEVNQGATTGATERHAVALLDRVFVIVLVIIAIFVLLV